MLRTSPTIGIGLLGEDPQLAGNEHLSQPAPAHQFPPYPWNTYLRRQHVDPRHLHHLRDRPPGGHADPAPGCPVNGDAARAGPGGAETRGELAKKVIGRAVVRLTAVAEARRH